MAEYNITEVLAQLFLLAALFAGISLIVVFMKAEKREKFISARGFDFRKFWMEWLATLGKGLGWAAMIFVVLMGSSFILRMIL